MKYQKGSFTRLMRYDICFLVRAFSGGGAQRDAVLLANGIARTGRRVLILVLDSAGPLRSLVDPSVSVEDVGRGKKLKMAFALPALASALVKARPTVFVSSEASGNALAVFATRLIPAGRRPFLVMREVASPLQARVSDPYLQNRLAYRSAPWLYPRADIVLALTEPVRLDLVTHFGVANDRAICFGTNAVLAQSREEILAPTPRTIEPGLLVAVGRLSQEKGFATLLDAMAILKTRVPARLVIVGEGPERTDLEARIAKLDLASTVELAGFHTDPSIFLKRAELFVSASRHEGLGNAIIEALALGVSIVSTDAPHGPREVLQNGRWGALVPVDDARALAEAIEARLTMPHNGAEGKQRATDFTIDNAAQTFLDILKKMGIEFA